jgi:D-sedoheptulose 7-phosphate isomerase
MIQTVQEEYSSHEKILEQMVQQSATVIVDIANTIARAFQNGNKVLLCGNGGSAADAQHVAAEFLNRFRLNRGGLPAVSLATDTSILTSIGNDSSFDDIFSRQVEALALKGDIVAGISTSGRSANILKALDSARKRGATAIGFTGENGRDSFEPKCDYCLIVPSTDTARIQECHGFVWHVICGLVEQQLIGKDKTEKSNLPRGVR